MEYIWNWMHISVLKNNDRGLNMKDEDLLKVLIETNSKREKPVKEAVLGSILSIVMLNPLDEDRAKSQEQIRYLLTKMGEWKNR